MQYELFKNIHTDLTEWIAGYASDSVVRAKFGSSKLLREMFLKSQIQNKNISPSWPDIRRGVRIPEFMSKELAEETGIHIGDGNLYIETHKDKSMSHKYSIHGDLINELLYHTGHVSKLMENLYGCNPYFLKNDKKNLIVSNYKSKSIVQFKNKILKLPIGSKMDISIPSQIMKEREFQKRCVVGIFDTDFTLTNNMRIVGTLISLKVIKQMHNILDKLNISHSFNIGDGIGKIAINKLDSINIIENWRLNNQKHVSKYFLWKEFKEVIPFSTTAERLGILDDKLEIEKIRKICDKRRSEWKDKRKNTPRGRVS